MVRLIKWAIVPALLFLSLGFVGSTPAKADHWGYYYPYGYRSYHYGYPRYDYGYPRYYRHYRAPRYYYRYHYPRYYNHYYDGGHYGGGGIHLGIPGGGGLHLNF